MSDFGKDKIQFFDFVRNIVNFDKLSHAYLIEVFDCESDFQKIKDFVKIILCEKETDMNCENCNICALVDDEKYPDLLIVEPEGKEIKKNQILSIQKEFLNKSLLDNKRVYIIKEADKLNVSAANTILKFLEEPEDNIIAILVTTNRYKIIETILSRCQVLSFSTSTKTVEVDDTIIKLVCYLYGSDNIFINYYEICNNIIQNKDQAFEIFTSLANVLLQFLEYSLIGRDVDLSENVLQLLEKIDKNKLSKDIIIIEEYLERLKFNLNYKLWLDSLFAKILGGD